jgi:hypothetical protein
MSTASAIGPVPGAGMGKTPWAIGTAEQVMRMDAKFKVSLGFSRFPEKRSVLAGDSKLRSWWVSSYRN